MSQEERDGIILTLSVMTFKPVEYFQDMDDRRLCEMYDALMEYK